MQDYQIFISYKSGDDAVAEQIYKALSEKGYLVFWDKAGITRGDAYNDIIKRAIESSKLFILLLSSKIIQEYNKSATERKDDSLYIIREVSIANNLRKLSRLRFFPFIIDDSKPIEYKIIFQDVFNEVDLGHEVVPTKDIPNLVCREMDALGIYPDKVSKNRYTRNQAVVSTLTKSINSLPAIIEECKNCLRYSSVEPGIRCPYLYDIQNYSDRILFNKESSKRTATNFANYSIPEPIKPDSNYYRNHEDLVDQIWEEERALWETDRHVNSIVSPNEISLEFESKNGAGHSWASSTRPCDKQRKIMNDVEKSLSMFGNPIFQRDLISLHKRITSVEEIINNPDNLQIAKRFDLIQLIRFINQQIRIRWRAKQDAIEVLVRENCFDSIYDLLITFIDKSSESLRESIRTNAATMTHEDTFSFVIIWWLLRENSNCLTHKYVASLPIQKRSLINKKLLTLCRLYEDICASGKQILFDSVTSLNFLDSPDDDYSSFAYNFLGFHIHNYQWNELHEMEKPIDPYGEFSQDSYTVTFTVEPQSDDNHNPLFSSKLFGLTRGIETIERKLLYGEQHGVPLIHYLYPIIQYSREFATHIIDEKCLGKLELIPTKRDTTFITFEYENPYNPCTADEEYFRIKAYHALFQPVSLSGEVFNEAMEKIVNGWKEKGIEMCLAATKEQDLESIVYMANYFAYSKNKDYMTAIQFYEIAVEKGIEFCMPRLAECYERIGNYRQAYRWYSVSNAIYKR